jgi:hypothetical protein
MNVSERAKRQEEALFLIFGELIHGVQAGRKTPGLENNGRQERLPKR